MKKIFIFTLLVTAVFAVPTSPTKLKFSNITNNSVTLSWKDNSNNESGFKIYRDGELIYITKPNETSYRDTFLYATTYYDYKVKATDFRVLDKDQKRRADQIISVFENNTTLIQYDYAEDIKDGRGVTAGRVGFTTENGDLLELLKRYNNIVSGSEIGKYVDILSHNQDFNQASFINAWKNEVANSIYFKDIQDKLSEEMYYYPAMEKAYELGLVIPVSLLVMYDTNIQHGMYGEYKKDGSYISGLKDIIDSTPTNTDEKAWIDEFLGNRKYKLNNTIGWEDTDYRITELWDILYGYPNLGAFTMLVNKWNNQKFDIK